MLRKLRLRLRALFHRDEIDEELRLHLEQLTDHLEARGMTPEEARRAARRHFGSVTHLREQSRDLYSFKLVTLLEQVRRDLRNGLRMFLQAPAFSIVAVLVLALGIGANTAMFTIVNVLLFQPLAGRGDDLVGLFAHDRTQPDSYRAFSYPEYADIRARSTAFDGLLAHTFALAGVPASGPFGETTRQTFVSVVSSNYFTTLGVNLATGRAFTTEEERPGASIPVVVVNYETWKRNGLDPAFIGRTVTVNAREFTVIGVTPRGFSGTMALASPEMWLPLGVFDTIVNDFFKTRTTGLRDRGHYALNVAGRLKPGLTTDSAAGSLDALARQLAGEHPAEEKNLALTTHRLPRVSTSTEPVTDGPLRTGAVLLMGMASIVLLIACLNIANMLLARGAARRREIAVRMAIGGGRWRIIQQLLTENLMLAAAGAGAGLMLSFWAVDVLVATVAPLMPVTLLLNPAPDVNVLAMTLAFAVISTLLSSLGPALALARTDVVTNLKTIDLFSARMGGTGGFRLRFHLRPGSARSLLVVGQIGLSLALLVTGGLFTRSALNAAAADPGFRYDRLLLASIDASLAGLDEARTRLTYRAMMERLRGVAGVESVTMTSTVPFGNFQEGKPIERVSGASGAGAGEAGAAGSAPSGGRSPHYYIVGSGYFRTLGLRMLRGREFTRDEEESPRALRVAIISEPLARQLFPNDDPIGQTIRFTRRDDARSGRGDATDSAADAAADEPLQIVGVAPGLRAGLMDHGPVPHLYVPAGAYFRSAMHVHIRLAHGGAPDERAALATIRRELHGVDARLPLLALMTMQGFHDRSLELWSVRVGGQLFATFGLLALTLAVVGVYGVKSFVVSQRTREIGIRLALGAARGDVLWLVLREGLWLTARGIAVGLPLAALIGTALSQMLYGVSPFDLIVFVSAPAILAVAALIACYLPARRATRIMPLTALRTE